MRIMALPPGMLQRSVGNNMKKTDYNKMVRLNSGQWVTLRHYVIMRKIINKISRQLAEGRELSTGRDLQQKLWRV